MNLLESHTSIVYQLCVNLIRDFSHMVDSIIKDDNGYEHRDAIQLSSEFVTSVLSEHSTHHKRDRGIKSNHLYVKSKTKALGTRWEVVRTQDPDLAVPRLLQSTSQYVSIVETLQSLFNNDEFRDVYIKHNDAQNKHVCDTGIYQDICCGSTFQKNQLFSQHPQSVQIMLAADDLEICNPLGSRSTIHKINAVYMTVRNMPPENSSQLNKIYLVSVCNVDDLKTKETDFNDIWQLVLRDIRFMEENGSEGPGQHQRNACVLFI